MLKTWCRFLPLAFVEWYARRNCELFGYKIAGEWRHYVSPFKGVLFEVYRANRPFGMRRNGGD
jgi:hypothetical protein